MKKPEPKIDKPCYDWHEISNYVEEKYNIELRNYRKYDFSKDNEGNKETPYCDFWHYLVYTYDIHNGSIFTLDLTKDACIPKQCEKHENGAWIKEILKLISDEFGTTELGLRASW